MAATLITLDVRTREQWRRWLATHHTSSPGIWLIRHKPHTGVTSMPYEDLVRQALCFGWVGILLDQIADDALESHLREARRIIASKRKPARKPRGM